MLKHADAHNFVESSRWFKIPIVAYLHAALLVQSCLVNSLPGKFCLWHTEGYPQHFRAVVRRRMDNKPTPATADVQHVVSTTKAQFAAYVIKLSKLCSIDVVFRSGEISTGVHHS